jgi:tellurite resistance protein TerC
MSDAERGIPAIMPSAGLLQAAVLGTPWAASGSLPPIVQHLLATAWLGTPLWMWAGFLTIVLFLLVLDLGVLHRKAHAIGIRESLAMAGFYISLGLAFGGWVWFQLGLEKAAEYWTGFIVEQSLSMDNVFVIALILSTFAIPRERQHRVLFWGVLGVIILRGIMITAGAAAVERFHWVLYVFAGFLIFTGLKLLFTKDEGHSLQENIIVRMIRGRLRVTDGLRGDCFFVREPHPKTGRLVLHATPLFVALVFVEFADILFAVDSVPAVFAITTDPFIVYTSNIFAILGLRSLFFALSALLERFAYLKYALSALLVFIGSKVFVADFLLPEGQKFPPALSLGVTVAILAAGFIYSIWRTRPTASSQSESAPENAS